LALLSTVAAVLLYCGYLVWRAYSDRQLRRMIEEERARYIGNLVKLERRITAIEDALKNTPFVPFKPKRDELH
jgi:plasmid maintenance system killer protein